MKNKSRKKKNTEKEAIRHVVEANQLCIAEALTIGTIYYKWELDKINDMVVRYYKHICNIDDMPDRAFPKWQISAAIGQKFLPKSTNIIEECRKLQPKRQDVYMLCIGCMCITLSEFGFSEYHINIFVRCVLYQLKENNVHPFMDRVTKELGYNVRTSIAWNR